MSLVEKGDSESAVKILKSIALTYEEKDINTAIEIYGKILLIDNSDVAVAKKLSKILQSLNRHKEAVFYLRSTATLSTKMQGLKPFLRFQIW